MADAQSNFMNALMGGFQYGQALQGQRNQSRLGQLAAMAQQAPRQGRSGLLSQMASIDPRAANAQRAAWNAEDEHDRNELIGMARFLKSAPPEQQQAAYQNSILPQLRARGMEAPDWTPETQPMILKTVDALIASAQPQPETPSAIRELEMLQANPQLAALDMQRRQSGQQWGVADVPDGRGGTVQMERNPYTGEWRIPNYGRGTAASGQGGSFGIPETDNYVQAILGKLGPIDPNASPETIAAQVLPHLIQQESGGNPNAVSPVGARGLTQVMPATGRDPGFGVRPLQNDTPQENVRFGRDYLTAMIRRYPRRLDQALAAYNAGPGRIPVQGGGPQVAQSGGGLGYTPPKAKQSEPVRTLTAGELRSMGFPAGSIVQQDADGTLKTVYTPKKDEQDANGNGWSPRQQTAVQSVQRNLIQYAAAISGLSPQQLAGMTADQIAAAVAKGAEGRTVQGGVARVLGAAAPGNFGREFVAGQNADTTSFAQGAGAAWAMFENPTGMVTNSDRESATAQMPNAYDPPGVQAQKIKTFLELSGWGGKGGSNTASRSGQPVRVQSQTDYNNLPAGTLYIAPDGSQRRKK